MPVAALAVGSVISAVGSKKAAKAQVKAGDQAVAEQQRQFDITQQNQQPYLDAGKGALANLQNPQEAFKASPGYEFARSEGARGIENSFAARGGAASGNALRALTEFSNGLASQDFGNWWNQQLGLVNGGQSSANALGQFGQRTADNVSSIRVDQGNARASGVAGVSNAIINAGDQFVGFQNAGARKPNSFAQPGQYSPYPAKRQSPYGYNPWVKN